MRKRIAIAVASLGVLVSLAAVLSLSVASTESSAMAWRGGGYESGYSVYGW